MKICVIRVFFVILQPQKVKSTSKNCFNTMNHYTRRSFTLVLAVLSVVTLMAHVPNYTNPVLPYDYSDPDVIRVGQTYLMTSSSFNNVPGLQLLASGDLVHWEIVDAAIRYRLPGYEEGDPVAGNFVWAPSIREHEGRLYIYYGDPDRGIYCIRSKPFDSRLPAIRFPLEWEEPVLVIAGKGLIDPCPLWDDDGHVWLVHALAGSRAGLKSVLLMAWGTSYMRGPQTVQTKRILLYHASRRWRENRLASSTKKQKYLWPVRAESDFAARTDNRQRSSPGRMGGHARRRRVLPAFSRRRCRRTHRTYATAEMG